MASINLNFRHQPASASNVMIAEAVGTEAGVRMCCVLADCEVGLAKHKSLASPSGTLGYTHAIYIYLHIYPFRDADLFTLFVLNQLSRSRGKSLTPDLSS